MKSLLFFNLLWLAGWAVRAPAQEGQSILNLRVKSQPESALVRLNDSAVGITPLEILWPEGRCSLQVECPGFYSVRKEILLANGNNTYNFRLDPVPRPADDAEALQTGRNLLLSGIASLALAGVWFLQYRIRLSDAQQEADPVLGQNYRLQSKFYLNLGFFFSGTSAALFAAGWGHRAYKKK